MAEWHPDFCPQQPGCIIITNADQSALLRFELSCAFHTLRRGLTGDEATFDDIRASTSIKERMRHALAREFHLHRARHDGAKVPSASLVPLVSWSYVEKLHLTDPVQFPLPEPPYVLCEPDGDFSAVTGELHPTELDRLFFVIEQEIGADEFARRGPKKRHRATMKLTTGDLAARIRY